MSILSDRILTFKGNPERTPRHLARWFPKPRNYEGSTAQTAEPGLIVPRIHRDAPVECRVFWTSESYIDGNGRRRIDFAFGLAVGEITGLVRLEAGNDRIPVYANNDIEDVVTGQRYFKALEVFTGTSSQEQSSIIKKHLGDDDTPYYRGLAYIVLKGFKLWKWPNKAVPALRAVIARNIGDI